MYQLDSVVLRCGAATLSAAVKISNSQWCTMYTVPVSFRDVLLTSTECHTREIHQSVLHGAVEYQSINGAVEYHGTVEYPSTVEYQSYTVQ